MKHLKMAVLALAVSFTANLSAQPAQAKYMKPAPGIKIAKITGTVNLLKNGLVVMTLRPGDPIPALSDHSISFAVVDGALELEASGEKISADAGANFTVTSEKGGKMTISVAEGTPVQIKDVSGNTIVLTRNSEVKITDTGNKTKISVQKGSALVTTSSGGEPKTVNAGDTLKLSAPEPAPAPGPEPAHAAILPVMPESSVIPSKTVQESCEVSGSTPGCNH